MTWAPPQPSDTSPPSQSAWYRKKRWWIGGGVLLVLLAAGANAAKNENEKEGGMVASRTTVAAVSTAPPTTDAPATAVGTVVPPTRLPTTTPPTTVAAVLTVTRVVDGDTVEVSSGRTVRLIGIDTPEAGECGYREAAEGLIALVSGQTVTLEAGARDDVERYGRLLRCVVVNGVDAGGVLVSEGLAVPRYNSTDGYGAHPREAEYAAEATPSPICPRATTAPSTTVAVSTPTSTPPPTAAPTTAASVYYANCDAVRAAGQAPLHEGEPGYRPRLDGDHDGVACE